VGAATAKLREPKHVRTRGSAHKLQSDERIVYETERIVSKQSEDRQAEQYRQFWK